MRTVASLRVVTHGLTLEREFDGSPVGKCAAIDESVLEFLAFYGLFVLLRNCRIRV